MAAPRRSPGPRPTSPRGAKPAPRGATPGVTQGRASRAPNAAARPPAHARSGQPAWQHARNPSAQPGCEYLSNYLTPAQRGELDAYLTSLHPLWEQRYSTLRPVPEGRAQHTLLRPVYWLGNWQFACLGYYEPPRKLKHRAVAAEPFPPVLKSLVRDIEARIRRMMPQFVPPGWHFNTCLINFYGDRFDGSRWQDVARVGEHRDFEPGPVASISLGERALFQFIRRGVTQAPPVRSMWLEDNSLQLFAGPLWKDELLHRVQRVERKYKATLGPPLANFATRRINLTLRYVPPRDICEARHLPPQARADIDEYLRELAKHAPFFARSLGG